MKKIIIAFVLAISTSFAFAQQGPGGNVFIAPGNPGNPNNPQPGSVCYGAELSVGYSGQSFFNQTAWLWSTGETTPTINITTSGTYVVTVTGNLGGSGQIVMPPRQRYYSVGPRATVVPLTQVKLCKWETAEARTSFPECSGASIQWYTSWGTGSSGNIIQLTFNNTVGPPRPDTVHVWYIAQVNGCTLYSDTVLFRSYRYIPGLSEGLCANPNRLKRNLTDSVPVGMVLNYPFTDELKYRVQFTEVTDSLNVIITETAVGSRHVHLGVLESGKHYYVQAWPVVNGVIFCSGDICTIGIKPASNSGNNLNRFTPDYKIDEAEKSFKAYPNPVVDQLNVETAVGTMIQVFSYEGKLVLEKVAENSLEQMNLSDLIPGLYVVVVGEESQKFVKK